MKHPPMYRQTSEDEEHEKTQTDVTDEQNGQKRLAGQFQLDQTGKKHQRDDDRGQMAHLAHGYAGVAIHIRKHPPDTREDRSQHARLSRKTQRLDGNRPICNA